MRASSASKPGSGDSFQVFVCWTDILRWPCKQRRASRPIVIGREVFRRK
jgi:hypothetical protein